MAKVKIVSNPYQKQTVFQVWEKATGQWRDINHTSSANSALLREALRTGFFPFKVKQIVDIILTEYYAAPEKLEIEFEGTDDEYRELLSVCEDERYAGKVSISKSSKYLENARDILPDVIDVFKELNPLVSESVADKSKIKRELDKFSDASNDVIPICVIGNYSSGKSTFINALIGYELLPCSDEPTTAKIYKISRSKQPDRAVIRFEYDGKSVRLRFGNDFYKPLTDPADNELAQRITTELDGIAKESIPTKLMRVMELINTYANRVKAEAISDLIEIEAPFDEDGLWGKIQNNFVIFDTPGSNSASNVKHYEVLKKAMEDLSNGLPIFVSEYDSLDSTDNDKLYQDINNMEELDNRFTMIIINKADAASLKKGGHSEEERERILSLAIPRNLYSGGIYFVSSIIGLGAKNDENFLDDHDAEIFEDQKHKYADPQSRFYKQLYRYNIMPEQIKRKYDSLAETHKNRLYANSGLYSVEQAIETFASVYSSYNKCQQSKLFLGKVIQITSDEIKDTQQRRETHRQHTQENLDKEKQALIKKLEQRTRELADQFDDGYPSSMLEHVRAASSKFTYDQLKEQEKQFLEVKVQEKDVEGRKGDIMDSFKALGDNFVDNMGKAFSVGGLSAFQKIGTGISEGFKDIVENVNEWQETKRDADKAASDELINYIRETFTYHVNEAQRMLETQSKNYWATMADQLKQELSQIVTNSTALSDQKRDELAGIIIEYQQLAFESRAEMIFDKMAFLRMFGDTDRLNTNKLARRYNREMQEQIDEIYKSFADSHNKSFDIWTQSLYDTIVANIEDFNPELRNQAEIIKEETARIAELETRRLKLSDYTNQIQRMMDWKES